MAIDIISEGFRDGKTRFLRPGKESGTSKMGQPAKVLTCTSFL